MDREQGLRKIVKDFGGPLRVCKMIATTGDANGISEHELTKLLTDEAPRKGNESAAQSFARLYTENLDVRKAIQVAKGTEYPQRVLDFKPTQFGGSAALNVRADEQDRAMQTLRRMADEMRQRVPELSPDQAFARVFGHPDNAALAARAHRRPMASSTSGDELQQ